MPKFSLGGAVYDYEYEGCEDDDSKPASNKVIAVHGSTMVRPMGRTKAKALAKLDKFLDGSSVSGCQSSSVEMVSEMKQKNAMAAEKLIVKRHTEWRKMAQMWMQAGEMENTTYYLGLVDEDTNKQPAKEKVVETKETNKFPSAVEIPQFSKDNDDDSTVSRSVNFGSNTF